MGHMLIYASRGLASIIMVGAIGFGMYKLIQVIYRGIAASNTSKDKNNETDS